MRVFMYLYFKTAYGIKRVITNRQNSKISVWSGLVLGRLSTSAVNIALVRQGPLLTREIVVVRPDAVTNENASRNSDIIITKVVMSILSLKVAWESY